jgi:hypothetical protein
MIDVASPAPGEPQLPGYLPPGTKPPDHQATLERSRICRADAIVLGSVEAVTARLNQSETGIFSNYLVRVNEWIHPPGGQGRIAVSALGGLVTVSGVTIGQLFYPPRDLLVGDTQVL